MKRIDLTRSAVFLFLASMIFLNISPVLGQEFCDEVEGMLDCTGSKTADIVIVMDTTGSMGGTINGMKSAALAFEASLAASSIDYKLGLTDCRDYPTVCDGWCGDSGDWAYNVYGLAPDDATWEGWINGLYAGGGADSNEAYLAALTHTATETDWRDGAQRIAILMCDDDPHPDGDCCLVEGETLSSTIAELQSQDVKVYVIHAWGVRPWASEITGATGGNVYIGSGSDISGILSAITEDLACTITVEAEAVCKGDTVMICAQLLGAEGALIPYSEGRTSVIANVCGTGYGLL
jgi:hypothetical protein